MNTRKNGETDPDSEQKSRVETGENITLSVNMIPIEEIPMTDFPGIRIGQAEDAEGGTGITVVLCEDPQGMPAGLHIGGGGPATRETGILDPVATAQRIHAAVLSGGSAFGLDAAGGVMRYLEEKKIGVEVRGIHVPLVTQVDLFDLPVGDPKARPDQAMGYAACISAEQGNYRDGCHGAGCGASIGKYAGTDHAMKSGIGACVLRQGDLLVGALIAVNAFGDIYDRTTGQKVAGAFDESGRFYSREEMLSFLRFNTQERLRSAGAGRAPENTERMACNTTIGIVFTNAPFRKPALCKIAAMAHDGLASSIFPVHTSGDGDSIIALSVSGKRDADQEKSTLSAEKEKGTAPADPMTVTDALTDVAGSLAVEAVCRAILRGVQSAESAYGYRALRDL